MVTLHQKQACHLVRSENILAPLQAAWFVLHAHRRASRDHTMARARMSEWMYAPAQKASSALRLSEAVPSPARFSQTHAQLIPTNDNNATKGLPG